MTSRQSVSRTLYKEQLISRTIATMPEGSLHSHFPTKFRPVDVVGLLVPRLIESSA